MQAITTKYLPATNVRGSRIKASCDRGTITIDYPHDVSGDLCHRRAVDALLAKFAAEDARTYGGSAEAHHWGRYITGGNADGNCSHVLLGRQHKLNIWQLVAIGAADLASESQKLSERLVTAKA